MSTLSTELPLIDRIEALIRPNLKFLDVGTPVHPTDDLGELGLDSLSSINLLFDLEKEFGVTIPDEALDENTFSNLASLEALVTKASNS